MSDQSSEPAAFHSLCHRSEQLTQYGARLIAGILIVAIAAVAYRTFAHHESGPALVGALLLLAAAVFACVAAMIGLVLGQGFIWRVVTLGDIQELEGSTEFYYGLTPILVLSEKVWLTFAPLGTVAYSGLQWDWFPGLERCPDGRAGWQSRSGSYSTWPGKKASAGFHCSGSVPNWSGYRRSASQINW